MNITNELKNKLNDINRIIYTQPPYCNLGAPSKEKLFIRKLHQICRASRYLIHSKDILDILYKKGYIQKPKIRIDRLQNRIILSTRRYYCNKDILSKEFEAIEYPKNYDFIQALEWAYSNLLNSLVAECYEF